MSVAMVHLQSDIERDLGAILVRFRGFVAGNNPTAPPRVARELLADFPHIGVEVKSARQPAEVCEMNFGNCGAPHLIQFENRTKLT